MDIDFKKTLTRIIKNIPITIFVLGVLIFICLNLGICWKLYESFVDDGVFHYWKGESVDAWFLLFFLTLIFVLYSFIFKYLYKVIKSSSLLKKYLILFIYFFLGISYLSILYLFLRYLS